MAAQDVEKLKKMAADAMAVVSEHDIVVFSKSWCPYCRTAISTLQDARIPNVKVVEVDNLGYSLADEANYMQALKSHLPLPGGEGTGEHRVPQLIVKQKYIGEFDDIIDEKGGNVLQPAIVELFKEFAEAEPAGDFAYDLFIVGGGSGGCAAAFEASKTAGLKVAVADFVKPASGPFGTTWGVGGTCVNVGCIPKKLMHIAATMGDVNKIDAESFGWKSGSTPEHSWAKLTESVQGYIKGSLNEGTIAGFKANGIAYYNKYATLVDRHTILLTDADGSTETVTAKYIMLSAGGRPNDGGFEGAELCISSDDLFWLEKPPGKTLVVGAAYIALECGGMLSGMGYEVDVMVRSVLLRGFDQECVGKIGDYMEHHGTNFLKKCSPTKFVKGQEKAVGCHFKNGATGEESYQEYDTVLLAIGRKGEAAKLGLDNAGVWYSAKTGKVEAPCERTNVPNIYCVGDLVEDRLELTPVAKVAAKKVVKKLFAHDTKTMNYGNIATTVFTPLEYGMVGYTEDQAKEKFGADVEVVTKEAHPLEWALSPGRANDANNGFFKVIVNTKNDKIIGFHMLGPNAGEVLQGMALAIKAGATKEMLDDTVGIHPTTAETMTMLSGAPAIKGVACAT